MNRGDEKRVNEHEHEMKAQHTPKRIKYIIFLIIGILTTIIAKCFEMHNPSAYTVGGILGFVLVQPISYFVILGIVALVVAAIRKSIKKYWFPVLAWLFLIAGLFDIVVGGFTEFVLRPKVNQAVKELVQSGKLEVPDLDPRERLIGHWSSEDDLTHKYFSSNSQLIIVNLGQQTTIKYSIEDFNVIEKWVKFSVSGANFPHTRTMYYLDDGFAEEIIEASFGKFQSRLKYVGPEQSP